MTEPALAVDPSDLNGYLESAGWRRGTSRGALVWALEPGRRLIVPERREYEDDDELLVEAVRSLASVEDRPELDVVPDISEPLVDAQFYRMQPDTPSGTIPLPAGLKAVQSVHDLYEGGRDHNRTRTATAYRAAPRCLGGQILAASQPRQCTAGQLYPDLARSSGKRTA